MLKLCVCVCKFECGFVKICHSILFILCVCKQLEFLSFMLFHSPHFFAAFKSQSRKEIMYKLLRKKEFEIPQKYHYIGNVFRHHFIYCITKCIILRTSMPLTSIYSSILYTIRKTWHIKNGSSIMKLNSVLLECFWQRRAVI